MKPVFETDFAKCADYLNGYYGTTLTGTDIKVHVTTPAFIEMVANGSYEFDTEYREVIFGEVCKAMTGMETPTFGMGFAYKRTWDEKAVAVGLVDPSFIN